MPLQAARPEFDLAPPFRLSKPHVSRAHNIVESIVTAQNMASREGDEIVASNLYDLALKGTSEDFSTFLIQHNWGAAVSLDGAGVGDAVVRLPSSNCMFEFVVNDHPVIWWRSHWEVLIGVLHKSGWVFSSYGCGEHEDDELPPFETPLRVYCDVMLVSENRQKLTHFLINQVRAACVALDAEVVEKEIVRAPYKLNAARAKLGRLPLVSYHILKLARRERAPSLHAEPGTSGRRLRMHFVRGHWRHFKEHKTWVRWHLRGDPDLGRIEKEYRL